MTSALLSPGDAGYPTDLASIDSPRLYVRGKLPAATGVAIVGTRKPSPEACAFTRELARGLVAQGFAIWSGGAAGVDAAAHEAALDAGGLTVVVAGGGLDRPYPRENVPLFERVLAEGGALLARVPDDTPPMPPGFLARNALLAAATSATVVVQAGLVSGARSTASAARRIGRTLCVVPHAPWDPRGHGCALELARGAVAVCDVGDVLAALGRPLPAPRARRRARPAPASAVLPFEEIAPEPVDLSPEEATIFEAIGSAPMCLDELCECVGLSAHMVAAAVLTLTLRAIVVEGPAGFVRRLLPSASSS